jgi:hypothetical protein
MCVRASRRLECDVYRSQPEQPLGLVHGYHQTLALSPSSLSNIIAASLSQSRS